MDTRNPTLLGHQKCGFSKGHAIQLSHDVITVADLSFSEGGFCYSIVCKVRVKNLRPRPLYVKPRPFPIVLERDFLLYLSINPFSIKIYAKAC